MEVLVTKEVERQLNQLPPRVVKYIKRVEVETYALNRLPALYASSERGWEYQYGRGAKELKQKITQVVHQAFAAVQVDPIRLSKPLMLQQGGDAQAALQTLRDVLQQPDLSWEDVVRRVRQLLRHGSNNSHNGTNGDKGAAMDDSQRYNRVWRPGTYGGSHVSWRAGGDSTGGGASNPEYGWDDARYRH